MTTDHPMYYLLHSLADTKTAEVQVKLKDYSPQPLGPGTIEHTEVDGAFRIITEVIQKTEGQFGQNQKRLLMPVIFSYQDVLWISERPIPMPEGAGNPLIVAGP